MVKRANKFNPGDEKTMSRLQTAVSQSYLGLEPFRQNRYDAVREMLGSHYSGGGVDVPVPFLELAVNTYARYLVANNPAVLCTTKHRTLKPEAYLFEVVLNRRNKEMRLNETLYKAVVDAMFCMGIVKTGITLTSQQSDTDTTFDLTEPYAEVVYLDDWVHDMRGREYSAIQFAGNKYRLPLEMVREMEIFNKKEREELIASEVESINPTGGEKVEGISQDYIHDMEEYKDHVELWDIWLPQEGLLVTIPAMGQGHDIIGTKPLRVVEWDGPERGPFHMLMFNHVPGNMMPLAPVMTWRELHNHANTLFRKMMNQAERQKVLGLFPEGGDEMAQRIRDAMDGELIGVNQPESVVEKNFGGVNNALVASFLATKDLFSYFAGNLDLLSGLSPQSETLGQDKLLAQANNRKISHMQEQVVSWTEEIIRSIAWYEWTDPLLDRTVPVKVSGTDIVLQKALTAETKEGDFVDYELNITPYSMHPKSPGERIQAIQVVFRQFIGPFMPLLEKQGISIDFENLLRTLARLLDMDELEDMLLFDGPGVEEIMEGAAGGDNKTRMPSHTSREQIRTGRPGATQGGKDQIMQNVLRGIGQSGDQMNAVGRSNG
jgi:hypothetical protein